ncbi:MAG: hypothetical protein R3282_01620, partial [Rhodothermales bacterium]|nr:hypothetical protein [Rhodothermales bacterium]
AEQSGEGGTEYERFGSFQEVAACARILQRSEYLGMPKRGHVFLERADLVGVDANTTEIHTVSTSHSQKKRDGMVAGGMEGRSRQSVEALGGLLEARDR